MIRYPLHSISLQSVAYDPTTQIMQIEFRNGSAYEYSDVPPEILAGLLAAESHGAYFNENIRNRFPYRRLSPAN